MTDTYLGHAANTASTVAAGVGSETPRCHANHHVAKFLALEGHPECLKNAQLLQLVDNGGNFTAASFRDGSLDISTPAVVRDTPQSIGMTVPPKLSVRTVADTLGPGYPVSVIDVKHQEELEGWTLGDLVEYFEDEERLLAQKSVERQSTSGRRQRKSVLKRQQESTNNARVLNQISLEFSNTPLSKIVHSPRAVRDLDWIDNAWPHPGSKPRVQYYCLTSAQGCYTDYHLDFGGTSVWYHVVEGRKVFSLIEPTPGALEMYEEWLCQHDQAKIFLPDLVFEDRPLKETKTTTETETTTEEDKPTSRKPRVLHVSLEKGQTLLIPTGWIHAVYTPIDSLVIGGNFLHGLDTKIQLDVHGLETRTRVPGKFRFPSYLPLMVHTGQYYLSQMRQGSVCLREVQQFEPLLNALRQWCRVNSDPALVEAAQYVVKKSNEFDSVEEWLDELDSERQRLLKDGIQPHPTKRCQSSLRLSISNEGQTASVEKTANPFRITLSSASKISSLPPAALAFSSSSVSSSSSTRKRQRRLKEDFLGYIGDNNDEDEWRPSQRNPRKAVSSAPRISLTGVAAQSTPPPAKLPQKSKPARVPSSKTGDKVGKAGLKGQKPTKRASMTKKPATTARQRLMKRFR